MIAVARFDNRKANQSYSCIHCIAIAVNLEKNGPHVRFRTAPTVRFVVAMNVFESNCEI